WIHAVQVEQIDHVGAQAAQAVLAAFDDRLGAAVGVDARTRYRRHDAALGRQHDVFPPVTEGLADERLVVPDAVNGGRIKERDADVEGAVDRANRLLVVARPIRLGHAHAPQTDRRNGEAAAAKLTLFHEIAPIL